MCRWFAGGVMFSWLSPGLDAGRLDHLAPFIGFVGDKLSKVDRLANAAEHLFRMSHRPPFRMK